MTGVGRVRTGLEWEGEEDEAAVKGMKEKHQEPVCQGKDGG